MHLLHIALDGAYNFRDLGGYLTKDGKQTAHGVFYRSDALHELSLTDQEKLVNMGLATVIDMRNEHEFIQEPNVFAHSSLPQYHAIPVFQANAISQDRSIPFHLGELYIYIVEHCQDALKQIFQLLLDQQNQSTVFHCKAGKDRTGVISAILLDAVQVPHENIIADYLLTRSNIAPLMDRLRESRPAGVSLEAYEPLLDTKHEYMEALLGHLSNQYGGSYAYLLHLGFPDAQLRYLLNTFVVPIET